MELKGVIIDITSTEQVTEKVKKRELIIEYAENPQYPQKVKFEAINDKCALLDTLSPGQQVEVHFNLDGRKWTDKNGKDQYFNSLKIWKINVLSVAAITGEVPAF